MTYKQAMLHAQHPESEVEYLGEGAWHQARPLLYFGEVMAGTFMNLYETLFVEFAHTERYEKHRFHECQGSLQTIADGFTEGYCAGDLHKIPA